MKPWFKTWLIATRPFSFPASSMPVVLGTVLAVVFGNVPLQWPLFIAALVGMVVLHAGANLLNDVIDFKKGLDKTPSPVSGAIVRGLISPATGIKGVVVLFAVGCGIGLFIAMNVGISIVILGAVGVAIGVLYTTTPVALKYHRLGDLAVFLDFGVFGSLGAWIVQTGTFSWLPVVWSIPLSMLVIAIVHANNWRDISSDGEGKIATVASSLGDKGSQLYYGFLVFGAFVFIILLTIISNVFGIEPVMPWTFMVIVLALPQAVGVWKKGARRFRSQNPMDFITLDGATAQLNLVFGLLCVVAVLLHYFLRCAG